jgi:hypothetical protein
MRLLSEWARAAYPDAEVWMRLRLGRATPLNPDLAGDPGIEGALRAFSRWADAVVVTRDELILVEAKVRSSPNAIGQLMLYRDLVPGTPELAGYLDRPLVLQLLVAVEDPAVTRLCAQAGIRHVVYRPPWLPEYLAQLHRRETVPPRDFAQAGAEP